MNERKGLHHSNKYSLVMLWTIFPAQHISTERIKKGTALPGAAHHIISHYEFKSSSQPNFHFNPAFCQRLWDLIQSVVRIYFIVIKHTPLKDFGKPFLAHADLLNCQFFPKFFFSFWRLSEIETVSVIVPVLHFSYAYSLHF